MAIGRISGALLFSDLDRQSTDLAFTTNGRPLAYMDFTNFRFGVNTNVLVDTFHVRGTANISSNTFINGNLLANATTSSTNTTTGALVVRGGAGIGGALYTGGIIDAAGNIVADSGVASSSSTTGALVVNGGAGISGNLFVVGNVVLGSGTASNVVVAATTSSTSATTGALVVAGGIGVSGNLNVGSGTSGYKATFASPGAGTSGVVFIGAALNSSGNGLVISSTTRTTADNAVPLLHIIARDGSVALSTTVQGNTVIGSSTVSTSTTTGALVVRGGVGIVGNLYVGSSGGNSIVTSGTIDISSNTQAVNTTTGAFIVDGGAAIATGNLYIGGSGGNAIVSVGDVYNQGNIWTNATTNTGIKTLATNAYVYNETATIVKIAGAGVAEFDSNLQATSTTTGAIQLAGGMSIASGNLYIAGSAGRSITATGNIAVTGDPSTSVLTGAITVVGGIGVNGNINAVTLTGNLTSTFGNVIITPLATNANAVVAINATSALQLPSGTTAQQPTPVYGGAVRWNSSTNNLEVYSGSGWISLLGQINNQTITPDGSNTVYTLDYSTTAEGIIVSINGTLQQPGVAYTVAGTQITFAEIPLSTDIISIRYIAAGTVTAENTQEINSANVALTTTPVIIDSFDQAMYRSAKYMATTTAASSAEFAEFSIVHMGATVAVSNVNRVVTGGTLTTFISNISGTTVRLWANTVSGTANIKLQKTYFVV